MGNTTDISYIPTVPSAVDYDDIVQRELLRWLDAEHRRIAQAISGLSYQYQVNYAPPAKFGIGFVAYADGTSWNPASGEGLYVYKSTGWSLLG